MIYILSYFSGKFVDLDYKNVGTAILSKAYEMETGEYQFKDGVISNGKKVYSSDDFNIVGNGVINKDKYGNVKFYIDSDGKCIYKNSLSGVKLVNSKCKGFEKLIVDIIKNNNTVSFSSLDDNLSYKISEDDNFVGEWINDKHSGNITLNKYSEGTNYIWFKDKNGNISDVMEFSIDCLNADGAGYNKDVFYCSGSVIKLDSMSWIVVSDNSNEITLMKKNSLEGKMSHCDSFISDNCYYVDENNKVPYKWSNSYINKYLNNEFLEELSQYTKYNLVNMEICDEFDNMTCNNESCGGLKKEEINKYGFSCNNYTYSQVRLLSYNEYNKLFNKLKENTLIKGQYLLINSYVLDKASLVDSNYEVYIMEDILSFNKIKPVITLKK